MVQSRVGVSWNVCRAHSSTYGWSRPEGSDWCPTKFPGYPPRPPTIQHAEVYQQGRATFRAARASRAANHGPPAATSMAERITPRSANDPSVARAAPERRVRAKRHLGNIFLFYKHLCITPDHERGGTGRHQHKNRTLPRKNRPPERNFSLFLPIEHVRGAIRSPAPPQQGSVSWQRGS